MCAILIKDSCRVLQPCARFYCNTAWFFIGHPEKIHDDDELIMSSLAVAVLIAPVEKRMTRLKRRGSIELYKYQEPRCYTAERSPI